MNRAEFERRRNCSRCGQRLVYAQVQFEGAMVQQLSKRCPQYDATTPDGRLHDFLEHDHEYPYRNRQGRPSDGTKRSLGLGRVHPSGAVIYSGDVSPEREGGE